MRISKRRRASMFKKRRKRRRFTRLWTIIMPPAAKLVRTKSLATALTRHHRAMPRRRPHLELLRTRGQQIRPASDHRTNSLPFVRSHRHREVKSVNKGHTVGGEVGVAVVEAELRERRRSSAAEAVAF